MATAAALAAFMTCLTSAPGAAQPVTSAGADVQRRTAPATGVAVHHTTLITGDRITVLKTAVGESVKIAPAAGREHIKFLKRQHGRDWTIIPADALPLVSAGRLDEALFNVSALVRDQRDNPTRLPLIVQYSGSVEAAAKRLTAAGADRVVEIPEAPFLTLSARHSQAAEFWTRLAHADSDARSFGAGIRRIWLDGRSKIQLDRSVPRIGAPHAWELGFTGTGVKVAVLDSGYDPRHRDLQGLVAEAANFTDEPNTDDLNGHGTHVTSTVAGSGALSGGKYKGVAPGALILSGKVCVSSGYCDNSDIVEGMAWAAAKGAKVINLSLGDIDTPQTDVLEAMVDTVTRDYGVLVVVAAGNYGPGKVTSPASADAALAVAASLDNDNIANFSSVGPRTGDYGLKPDIAAPGVGVVAARAGGTSVEDGYAEMSGTSMAAPHVAGAAAILFQQHPDWTPQQVKRQLMQSATGAAERGAYYQGSGRVDIARAVDQEVTALPAGLDFGQIRWSDAGRPPVSKELTFTNPEDRPVVLNLGLKASYGRAATPAPDGIFELSADQLTIAAHSSAEVTVTATPEAGQVHAAFSGAVTAATTDRRISLRVPIGMDVEQPSYDLRVDMKSRTGAAPDYAYLLVESAGGTSFTTDVLGENSTVLRLPRDTYSVSGFIFDESFTEATVVGVPKIVMNADQTALIDARKANPVTLSAPSDSARIVNADVGTIGMGEELLAVTMADAVGSDRIEGLYAVPTAKFPDSSFTYLIDATWGDPAEVGSNPGSVYYLTRPVHGLIPDKPGYHPRKSELAAVTTTFAAAAPGGTADRFVWTHVDKVRLTGQRMPALPVPTRRVDYFSAFDGVQRQTSFDQWNFLDPESQRGQSFLSTLHSYEPGSKVTERWNGGVQAMGLTPGSMDTYREGDRMTFVVQDAANGNLDLLATTTAGESTMELSRNGQVISQLWGGADVPHDGAPATYRLTVKQDRDLGPSSISTRVRATWQFTSSTTTSREALPLYAVRMSPELDEWNRARADRKFDIPVRIQRAAGAVTSAIRTFTTDVSYDEGKSWQRATVTGTGVDRTITVRHPHRGKSVSLRTHVVDDADNSFSQTVINAYLLK